MHHSHAYFSPTTYDCSHMHYVAGVTSIDKDCGQHCHSMKGSTTYDDGHKHHYCTETGPSIPCREGHVHYFCTEVEYEDGHVHRISGYTSAD